MLIWANQSIFMICKTNNKFDGYKLKDIDNRDGDIEINIVGLKKGEKINEELHRRKIK